MDIRQYIEETDLTLAQIASVTGSGMKAVRKVWDTFPASYRKTRKAGCYARSKTGALNASYGKTGVNSPYYIGDISDGKGYLMRLKPEWYTGRRGSKHVFVHQLVVCEGMGITCIPAGWAVHHCDNNPHNNSFDNLVLITLADHRRLHSHLAGATTISKESTLKWVEAHGTPFRREDIV